MLTDLRVLVVHDWIFSWAGSERCLALILDLFPQADFVVGMMAPSLRDFNDVTRRARESWLARVPKARTHYQWFLPLEAMAFGSLATREYDLVITSRATSGICMTFTWRTRTGSVERPWALVAGSFRRWTE